MRVDLHTHSVCSDGTHTPTDLIYQAARSGLDVVALTDHDTTDGWDDAALAADQLGVRLVRGLELSTKNGASLHLLAYGVDPAHPGLLAELDKIRHSRVTRAQRMVDLIAADYPLTWDDVRAQAGEGATVGRPHIADALIGAGYFGHRDDAFDAVLNNRSKYHVPHYAVPTAEAVRLVRSAGGVPVLAHSLAARQKRSLDEELLVELVDAGLAGLEVDHRDHDEAAREQLRAWCGRYDLIPTGGSDYHGAGKRNELGENLTSPEAFARLLG